MYGNKIIKFIIKSIIVFMAIFLIFTLTSVNAKTVETLFSTSDVGNGEAKLVLSENFIGYSMIYVGILILAIINLLIIRVCQHSLKTNNKLLKFIKAIEIILIILPILILIFGVIVNDIYLIEDLDVNNFYGRVPTILMLIRILFLFQNILFIVNFILFIIYTLKNIKESKNISTAILGILLVIAFLFGVCFLISITFILNNILSYRWSKANELIIPIILCALSVIINILIFKYLLEQKKEGNKKCQE